MIAHYLAVPGVRDWLFNRNPTPSANALPLATAFSYACMYYSPASAPRTPPPYALPEPYLDFGDVLLWQHVYDGIAVGNLYNKNERHALAHVRDSALQGIRLSSRPRKRNFAADLRVDYLELVEFAWMSDNSLIIACRRLHTPPSAHHNRLVLSCDILCYPVLSPSAPSLASPILTIVLRERPTVCHFCGVRGMQQQCACPPSFKRRAPAHAERPTPSSPYSSSASAPSSPSSSSSAYEVSQLLRRTPPNSQRFIEAWLAFCKRLFTFAQSGSFFVHMYRHWVPNARPKLFYSPAHPVPYQFVCGDRSETLQLLSLYVRRVQLCQRLLLAECRLQSTQPQLPSTAHCARKHRATKATTRCAATTIATKMARRAATGVENGQRDGHGATAASTASVARRAAEQRQQFLMQFDSDLLLGRLSMDGSSASASASASPSTTVTGNSPTSSYREGGAVGGASAVVATGADGGAVARGGMGGNNFDDIDASGALLSTHADGVTGASVMADSGDEVAVNEGGIETEEATATATAGRRAATDREVQVRRYMTCDAQNVPACRKCGHRFQKRGNLIRHIQAVHLKLKPFVCALCSARFGYKTHLKRHQQKHQRRSDVALFEVRA
ncbi:unnamed protein product [Agarophyton chilense]